MALLVQGQVRRSRPRRPALCVVVPTRNERDNVAELVGQLEAVLPLLAEVLFVDDSDDDTPSEVVRVATHSRLSVRLLHRRLGERDGGLAGAVVVGLRAASAPWAVVMDGDLQHPPALVPELWRTGCEHDLDVVIASRYCAQGDAGGLSSSSRHATSVGATALARVLFPRRLRGVTDPMTGFFAVRVACLDLDAFRPHGFKVLLELLVRTRDARRVEVPFAFGARHRGQSKATLREGVRYLTLLARLRLPQGGPAGAVVPPVRPAVAA